MIKISRHRYIKCSRSCHDLDHGLNIVELLRAIIEYYPMSDFGDPRSKRSRVITHITDTHTDMSEYTIVALESATIMKTAQVKVPFSSN